MPPPQDKVFSPPPPDILLSKDFFPPLPVLLTTLALELPLWSIGVLLFCTNSTVRYLYLLKNYRSLASPLCKCHNIIVKNVSFCNEAKWCE